MHCGVRARLETARARGSPHAHARPPPQCATPRGRRESRPRHSPEGSKGAGSPGRLRRSPPARARTRPHVSLRPRGMWVTEPSGLTCPRPPPPPQRPLCNAASRARPANRRPRAAERKHSAHVARAARPCEGGAGPALPGRAAALQGAGRAAVERPRGRSGNRARADTHRAVAHPTSPAVTPPPPPPIVPQRDPRAPSVVPPLSAVRLLPAFTSMVPSGRGPRLPASRRGGSAASASAPRRPGLEAAVVAGPPHGQGGRGAREPGPAARERAAVREGGGGRRAALLAESLTTKAAARRLPAASAPRRRGRLTGRAAATM